MLKHNIYGLLAITCIYGMPESRLEENSTQDIRALLSQANEQVNESRPQLERLLRKVHVLNGLIPEVHRRQNHTQLAKLYLQQSALMHEIFLLVINDRKVTANAWSHFDPANDTIQYSIRAINIIVKQAFDEYTNYVAESLTPTKIQDWNLTSLDEILNLIMQYLSISDGLRNYFTDLINQQDNGNLAQKTSMSGDIDRSSVVGSSTDDDDGDWIVAGSSTDEADRSNVGDSSEDEGWIRINLEDYPLTFKKELYSISAGASQLVEGSDTTDEADRSSVAGSSTDDEDGDWIVVDSSTDEDDRSNVGGWSIPDEDDDWIVVDSPRYGEAWVINNHPLPSNNITTSTLNEAD